MVIAAAVATEAAIAELRPGDLPGTATAIANSEMK
jgi:hypothetical protein